MEDETQRSTKEETVATEIETTEYLVCKTGTIRRPKVGMPATLVYYSDRVPAEVIAVSATGKKVTVREMRAERIDNYGMSDCQEWRCTPDPEGEVHTFRLCESKKRKGFYTPDGGVRLTLGEARKYFDFGY